MLPELVNWWQELLLWNDVIFIFWRLLRLYWDDLRYRRSWSYITSVGRILCHRRYEKDELFSQTQLKLCRNFRNVYVLINWACACMISSSRGVWNIEQALIVFQTSGAESPAQTRNNFLVQIVRSLSEEGRRSRKSRICRHL